MPKQINLYNPDFEEQRALLSFKGAALGWAATALLIAAWAASAQLGLRSAIKQEREVAAQFAAAQAEMQALAGRMAARKQSLQVAAAIAKLEAEVRGRQEVMAVLQAGGLGDTRGFSEHLKAFARQSFEGVWLTGLRISAGGRDMAIEGRALQPAHVPGYLKRLNSEAAMQGHPFSELLIQMPKADPAQAPSAKPWYVEFRLATRAEDTAAQKAGVQ